MYTRVIKIVIIAAHLSLRGFRDPLDGKKSSSGNTIQIGGGEKWTAKQMPEELLKRTVEHSENAAGSNAKGGARMHGTVRVCVFQKPSEGHRHSLQSVSVWVPRISGTTATTATSWSDGIMLNAEQQ